MQAARSPRQVERGTGSLLKPAKYSKIWSRHLAESAIWMARRSATSSWRRESILSASDCQVFCNRSGFFRALMIIRAKFLPQRFARFHFVIPRAAVEPEEEFFGAGFNILQRIAHRREVLLDRAVTALACGRSRCRRTRPGDNTWRSSRARGARRSAASGA